MLIPPFRGDRVSPHLLRAVPKHGSWQAYHLKARHGFAHPAACTVSTSGVSWAKSVTPGNGTDGPIWHSIEARERSRDARPAVQRLTVSWHPERTTLDWTRQPTSQDRP